jgi:type VI secretion system protein ImpF
MAALKRSTRLSPPLMWAFRSAHEKRDARVKLEERDEEGARIIPGRKSAASASLTEPMLRREVRRDLEILMNTVALESFLADVAKLDHVRQSVLNFGLPDTAHRSIDELARNDGSVEQEIETALTRFEPRLIAGTIRVGRDMSVDTSGLKVRFLINADLACRPVDIPVEFTAEIELDSGKIMINPI